MQALSTFYSKNSFLATNPSDSNMVSSSSLRRRRKKRWVSLGSPFGCMNCSRQSYMSRCSGGLKSWSLGRSGFLGFLSKCSESSFYGPKRSRLGRSSAFTLALEQEPVGCENEKEESDSEESESSDDSIHGVVSDQVVENKAEPEEDHHRSGAELVVKEKIDVRKVASSLWDAKTADNVEEVFRNLEALPLPVYSTIIRGFGIDKRLDSAFALVEWLKTKSVETGGFVGPNLFIYNSLLGAVKQAQAFDKVDEVIEDMKVQGIVPNIVTYNTLMSVHLEQGQPGEALRVLDDIEKNGLLPSPVTYSTLLLAYREMEDASRAIAFFVKLKEKYVNGEIGKDKDYDWETEFVKLQNFTIRICYLVMRQSLVEEDDPSTKVFKVLGDMDRSQMKPGRTECERLVWACTRESHYTVARELYNRIREMDSDISLSVCNHVIWLMGKAKKWWAALEVYEDLLDKGPRPNNLSYELIISHFNILLTAARRKGIWRWGVRLINKMLDKGLRPGTREWNAVLIACSKASETSAAVQIFRRMVEQGEKPTILSYGALLSALEKGKLYEEALQVWEHMCKVGIKPNLHAYTILASVYIGKGSPEMVDYVLQQMSLSKIEPSVVTFNAIITGCAKKQMSSAAFEWFQRMKVRNIKPNEITYEMLIEALAQDGKPKLAYEMYLRASNEGLNLSSRAYDVVTEACRAYNTSIDTNVLGPRPLEKRRNIKIRKNLSEFCNLANLRGRSKPFDKAEVYTSQMQER